MHLIKCEFALKKVSIKMINKLFKNRYFLPALQFISLFVFIMLIYGAIGITTQDKDFAKILRNTNLANLIVWSYWWPFIIITAILFGRFWCTICPMELVTSFFGKMGLRKKPGKVDYCVCSVALFGFIFDFTYCLENNIE